MKALLLVVAGLYAIAWLTRPRSPAAAVPPVERIAESTAAVG